MESKVEAVKKNLKNGEVVMWRDPRLNSGGTLGGAAFLSYECGEYIYSDRCGNSFTPEYAISEEDAEECIRYAMGVGRWQYL